MGNNDIREPPTKKFKAKHSFIPNLTDYSVPAPDTWWDLWPKVTWEEGQYTKSPINPRRLMIWVDRADDPEKALLQEIFKDLRQGCDLGTRGEYLCPSTSTNAPSAYEYGDRVTDSIVDGVMNKIMMGPMTEAEIPFESIKVNGIMVKLKESGAARVILNMSRGEPFCPNDGMSNDQRFDVTMSSTAKWLRSLHSAGQGCYMVKLDWAAAYKQIRVQSADIRQQFFYWAGRYFAELCLIFGGGSSVGIYDRVAKRVKYAATKLSYMPPEQVQQIIDDVCAAGTKEEVTRFYRKYREIAKDCNIQLASESDKDKAFEACQEGVVFGVVYNTATFTCWLREDKLSRLMEMLDQITDNPDQTIHYMKRVAGKVVAYKMLVPHGKFYMGQLIRMAGLYDPEKESMNKVIRVSDWARSEAYFWRVMLPFCGKRIILPNPDFHLPPSAIHAYTDAAGGSTTTIGMGCGAVMGSWWAYLPWGTVINGGSKYRDGKMFKHKMSAWELVGPLVVVSAGADLLRNKSVVIPVDNIGSVAVFKKG